MVLDFREYLTEVNQNQLYKEFLKVQKNPHQLELALDFKDEIFTNKEDIARHILRQLNFISIGFEFEMYLMKQNGDDENIISLQDIDRNILETAHKYFDFIDEVNIENDYIVEFKKEAIKTIDWFLFIIIASSSKKLLQNEYYDKIKELSRMFVNPDS